MARTIQIDHDHNVLDIMDAVNHALKGSGYSFVDDDKEHDGFIVYELKYDGDPMHNTIGAIDRK